MRVEYTRKDFLEALFQRYFTKREGFILVRAVRHLDHKISTRFFPNIELAREGTVSRRAAHILRRLPQREYEA